MMGIINQKEMVKQKDLTWCIFVNIGQTVLPPHPPPTNEKKITMQYKTEDFFDKLIHFVYDQMFKPNYFF